jgi:ribosomal protein S18 acetylase RimI-like enzyme
MQATRIGCNITEGIQAMNTSLIAETVSRTERGSPARATSCRNGDSRTAQLADVAIAHEAALSQIIAGDGTAWRLGPATAADHHLVQQFLSRVFHRPSPEAFSASLEDPLYEPCDRLVVRRGPRLAAHLLVSSRAMQLGHAHVPASQVSWLATLPEYRGQRFARRLLQMAEAKLAADGSLLGWLSTSIPQFFEASGWVLCGRAMRWVVSARELLARLIDEPQTIARGACIRPWRQVELPALVRLYSQNTSGGVGAFVRNEAYWRWLISRRAFDALYVATDSPGRCHLDEHNLHVVGYAVTKQSQLLELMADPTRPDVARQLLHRVCGDALEMDCHHLTLHAPPGNSMSELLCSLGGYADYSRPGDYVMAKVPDLFRFLDGLRDGLLRRAAAAGLPRPCELGLACGREKYHLAISRRNVKVSAGKLGRTFLRGSNADLTRLLLGALDLSSPLTISRLATTGRQAATIAAALFPRLPMWRPPLDELME